MRPTARRVARRLGFHVGRRRYFDLVERRPESPVPDLEALPAAVFERESPLLGLTIDTPSHMAFAQAKLAPFVRELDEDAGGFNFRNLFYAAGDAHLAYAMVRHLRPRRVVELGSGHSTRVIALACERNAAEGNPPRYGVFDPYPSALFSQATPSGVTALRPLPAQEVPDEEFAELVAGDLLFVDTSHTVKLGGDVNRIILDVLPGLAAGVHVHFHDIWLPFEYHPELVKNQRLFWSEQYLLQAFLAMNADYEITFATRAACVREAQRFRALVPRWTPDLYPTSFWIRRAALLPSCTA